MNASRRILLKHFDARAAEYDKEIANGAGDNEVRTNSGLDEEPVCIAVPFFLHILNGHNESQKSSFAKLSI